MASDERRRGLSIEEFTEQLAEDLDEDPDDIRAAADAVEVAPPWEGEVEASDDR